MQTKIADTLCFLLILALLPIQTAFGYPTSAHEYVPTINMKVANEISHVKSIALTYDDGPHHKYTPIILDLLHQYQAKATFFVIGDRLASSKELVKRIAVEGHDIGNHTFSHKPLDSLNKQDIQREIEKANEEIEEVTGIKPTLIRPPTGTHNKRTDEIIKEEGLSIVLWNLDTADWRTKSAEKIANEVIKKVKSGDIILMHDFYTASAEATELILKALTAEGYHFVTVTDLIEQKQELTAGDIYYKQPN